MPSFTWVGKSAVENHDREVPYRLLQCNSSQSHGPAEGPNAGHLLVQGDNLEALKALLPYYRGQVKCVYIDPPYNTGNEEWRYNDNVNSPTIRRWFKKAVGREAEDLNRHDKWLCMMYPRLKLLREFLADDGMLFVSIDDNEAHHLRMLLDEIMGGGNIIGYLVWEKGRKNDAKFFSMGHEYLAAYAKSKHTLRAKEVVWREMKPGAVAVADKWRELSNQHGDNHDAIQHELRMWYKSLRKGEPAKLLARYKWVDERGPWRDRDISWPGGGGPRYEVPHPVTGKPCQIPDSGWRFATSEKMQDQIENGLVEFRKDHTKPPFRKAYLLNAVDDDDGAGYQVMPSVIYKQSQVAVKSLKHLFDGRKVFDNPKDHEVIARLIRYVTKPGDLILDSFAGSGTTLHAVLNMNAADGGRRRCILVEMETDIARNVTAERVRRVIDGYGSGDKAVPGTGGGFRYCTLGDTLTDEHGLVRDTVKFADLAHHVYFRETGQPLQRRPGKDCPFIGEYVGTGYFLLFNGVLGDRKPAGGNVLTKATLAHIKAECGAAWEAAEQRVIYGEANLLAGTKLERESRIEFKQIPYDLNRRD